MKGNGNLPLPVKLAEVIQFHVLKKTNFNISQQLCP